MLDIERWSHYSETWESLGHASLDLEATKAKAERYSEQNPMDSYRIIHILWES